MPEMGRPVDPRANAFNNVRMAPKNLANSRNAAEPSEKEKEKLLNRLTGYKPKNDLYKDADKHNKMGKDEFLKLLTVQLKNQDPFKPMEQNKMAAELAQFSQLEQLTNLNTKFDKLTGDEVMEDKFYGASFLGKEVLTAGTSLNFKGEGTDADILFALQQPADKIVVRVFDSKNNIVGEQWKENVGRGNQAFIWDGEMMDGQTAVAGQYTVKVFAWDKNAEPLEVKTQVKGTVDSVFFENGETVLLVDGKKVFLRDVDSFHMAGKTEENLKQVAGNPSGQAKMGPKNLPLASPGAQNIKLNKIPTVKMPDIQALKSYKQNSQPSTGVTNVYDQ